MLGGKGYAGYKPGAFGLQANTSAYGSTIPVVLGTARGQVYLIWAANLQQQGKSPKSKKGSTIPSYTEAVDFLVAMNPCFGVLQFWRNQQKVGMNFNVWRTAPAATLNLNSAGSPHDTNAYFINAVTATVAYPTTTFNDYGAAGSSVFSAGTYEVPLWNLLMTGPDPTNPSGYRNYPWVYTWQPSGSAGGPNSLGQIFLDAGAGGLLASGGPLGVTQINVYYSVLDTSQQIYSDLNVGTRASPAAALRLGFESVLGDGPEYTGRFINSGTALNTQQIYYPHYCGLGGANLDLGNGQILPSLLPEVSGMFNLYPPMTNGAPTPNGTAGGDADYADMAEYIVKSGLTQAGLSVIIPNHGTSKLQAGLSCFDLPGSIQKIYLENGGGLGSIKLPSPINVGNYLVLFVRYDVGASHTPGVSDSLGNAWTTVVAQDGLGVFYAPITNGSNPDTITISGGGNTHTQIAAFEVAGVVSFATSATATGSTSKPTVSVTTSATQQTHIMAFVDSLDNGNVVTMNAANLGPHWNPLITPIVANLPVVTTIANFSGAAWRTVYATGTYRFTYNSSMSSWKVILLAFTVAAVPDYPRPLGNVIDDESMALVRSQDRAYGLWGSLLMDSQRKGGEWLKDLAMAMNAAPVWSGFKLKFKPYAEQSYLGNGAKYTSPTAAGPVADLVVSDFIGSDSQAPVIVTSKAQWDRPPIVAFQHPYRGSDYNDVTTEEPDAAALTLYGTRKGFQGGNSGSPTRMPMIYDTYVARLLLAIQARRQNYLGNKFEATLHARWKLLEPMDLVTISDPLIGVNGLPVRVVSIEEDENHNLKTEFEPFQFGVSSPLAASVTTPVPYRPTFGHVPTAVNPPVIIEPVAGLTPTVNGFELWLCVSDSDPYYGGCVVFMSTDGAASYNPVGQIAGTAVTGKLTADWPAGQDPDTTNDLSVDLSESISALSSYQVSDEDNLTYPVYVAGTTPTSPIPYELMTYAVAELTSAYNYKLKATGAGNSLRRDVFSAPNPGGAPDGVGLGCDHPVGATKTIIGITNVGGLMKIQTSAAHLLATGNEVFIDLVVGTGGLGAYLNGKYWQATVVDSTHATLNNSTFADVTFNEAFTIPGTPYQVTVANAANFIADDGVFYSPSEVQLTSVASSPAQGEYVVNVATGVYTFAAADEGQAVTINYTSTGAYTSGGTIKADSRFAFIDPSGAGRLEIPLTQTQLGSTLHFKFQQFNNLGGGYADIESLIDYVYTPSGIGDDTGVPIGFRFASLNNLSTFDGGYQIQAGLVGQTPPLPAAANVDSVDAETFTLGYIDEPNISSAALISSFSSTGALQTINVDTTNLTELGTFVIENELFLVDEIVDGTHAVVQGGYFGSSTATHLAGAFIYPLVTINLVYPYAKGQFVSQLYPLGGNTQAPIHTEQLSAARFYWVSYSITNIYGTTQVSLGEYLGSADGVRTYFGETITLAPVSPGNNVIQTGSNLLSSAISPNASLIPKSIQAKVADAPNGTSLDFTLFVNGVSYATVTIPNSATSSNIVSGDVLGTLTNIAAGATLTCTITVNTGGATYNGDGPQFQVIF